MRPARNSAIELFCYRAARELGSLAAAMRCIDALVFAGGIGENAAPIRGRIVELSQWLEFDLDRTANASHARLITEPSSRRHAYVVTTDEALMIARHTRETLASA